MTCEPEYQQPKFATKRKDENTFDVDGREIAYKFGSLEVGYCAYVKMDGEELTEQRVSDVVRGYESGKQYGRSSGEADVKREIKNWLGVE